MRTSLATWFGDRPIRTKFWIGSTFTTILALTLAAGVVTYQQAVSMRKAAMDDMEVFSTTLAANISAAVAFEDADAAQNLLDEMARNPNIVHLDVRLRDGRVLASYENTLQHELLGHLHDQASSAYYDWSGAKMSKNIRIKSETVGSLEVHASFGQIHDRLGEFAVALALGAVVAFAVSILVIYRIGELIAAPLRQLADVMNQISRHDRYDLRAPHHNKDEIGELANGFNNMISQIEVRDAALDKELLQRKRAEAELARLAHYDAVTGLPNRHYFNERLKRLVGQPAGDDLCPAAVLFFDLDNFKKVNDTLGHGAGDLLLQEVARRLAGGLRSTDTLCRLGGDEFAVLVEKLEDEYVTRVCEKSLEIVRRPFLLEGEEVHVSASIGASVYPDDGRDAASLLRNADTAMYHAKNGGKNAYALFRPEMNAIAVRSVAMESKLRQAINEQRFEVFYQIQINPIDGRVDGVEALVRWQDAERGIVPPSEFIPFAEQNGLIVPIGRIVLKKACAQLAEWQTQGIHGLNVSVNISAEQILDPDFVDQTLELLGDCGLDPHLLTLELTESTVMDGTVASIRPLERLAAAGIKIAIDDFGTGYSSMAYLKRFPISILKIDRSFVADLPEDSEDRAISAAIITMAHSLGMIVCAEGVETLDQAEFLYRRECDLLQGYLFSKPLCAAQVRDVLQQALPIRLNRETRPDSASIAG